MKTEEFDYHLPSFLIAQKPIEKRDESRLLVMDKKTGEIEHKHFYDIVDYFKKGDVLVINDTKVIPARIIGTKEETGAIVELLMIKEKENDTWECLVKPYKRVKIGTEIKFSEKLIAKCVSKEEGGIAHFQFSYEGIFLEVLEELGSMPLPPYITEKLEDKDRYQTVYAKNPGSVAAPTAGLHFTENIFSKLKEKGVIITTITLHVGIGTFRPVTADNIDDHKMHSEFYSISDETCEILNLAKKEKRRIISVGTTSTRTLESVMMKNGKFISETGSTDIFIYPGYKFLAIDCLLTNFHLPKSTLIMLVSAFSKKEYILKAYKEAVSLEYRFFSFGDAMFIK